jgi:hypothetical protein
LQIDTEIRHMTEPAANLFLEFGFAPDEAQRLQAALRTEIDYSREKPPERRLQPGLAAPLTDHCL